MTFHTSKLIDVDNDYPKFITKHPIFGLYGTIEKIFPRIGLRNCSVKAAPYATPGFLRGMVEDEIDALLPLDAWSGLGGSLEWANRVEDCLDNHAPLFSIKRGKVCFDVPSKYLKGKTLAQIFPRTDGYRRDLKAIPARIKERLSELKIVFSSDGEKGMWDTATMSERGFNSCQSWDGQFRRNLVGTMVDPFAGIIYLTNEYPKYRGEEMLARSVVRYVRHKKSKKPHLLIERVYTQDQCPYFGADELFAEFLSKKTGLPIIYGEISPSEAKQYAIPLSKIVRDLKHCPNYHDAKYHCLSYRDSQISYSKSLLRPY